MDINVDIQHWRSVGSSLNGHEGEHRNGHEGEHRVSRQMVALEPQISLGLAQIWLAVLNTGKLAGWAPGLTGPAAPLPAAVMAALHAAARSYRGDVPSEMSETLLLVAKAKAQDRLVDERDLRSIAALLQGRALLLHEFADLLSASGLQHAQNRTAAYLQAAYLRGAVGLANGFALAAARKAPWFRKRSEQRCRRCGSGPQRHFWTQCAVCGGPCPYCEQCLAMGRVRQCSLVIYGTGSLEPNVEVEYNTTIARQLQQSNPAPNPPHLINPSWGLSPAQEEAAQAAIHFLKIPSNRGSINSSSLISRSLTTSSLISRSLTTSSLNSRSLSTSSLISRSISASSLISRSLTSPSPYSRSPSPAALNPEGKPDSFLIWAVTGAGKTEMIFPLLEFELNRGGRVLVAAPRRDVILELQPRLQKAFPNHSLTAIYGGSEERWLQGDIVLATTHQLIRFREAFDLVVIDEIDAFPFHNDPMLEYAATNACKPRGKYIFLSATPPISMQKLANSGKLPHVKVPVRYHRYPLPIPRFIRSRTLHSITRSKSPRAHRRLPLAPIQASVSRGAQVFIFVPEIRYIMPLVTALQQQFPAISVKGTSSRDAGRDNKVSDFRAGTIRILVTTTILERGVTVPKCDVMILDADSPLFDAAALIQMAGRAGRSADDPGGRVYFAANNKTRSQVQAIRTIQAMNNLAQKKGLLINKNQHKLLVKKRAPVKG